MLNIWSVEPVQNENYSFFGSIIRSFVVLFFSGVLCLTILDFRGFKDALASKSTILCYLVCWTGGYNQARRGKFSRPINISDKMAAMKAIQDGGHEGNPRWRSSVQKISITVSFQLIENETSHLSPSVGPSVTIFSKGGKFHFHALFHTFSIML